MEGLYYVRAARTAMGMDPGPELESLTGQKSRGHRHRGPARRVRGPRDRGVTQPVGAHPELLPRRSRRRPSGAGRLVLRAVVEACSGRRRLGRGLGVPVQRIVLGHGRRRLRRAGLRERLRRRLSRTASTPGSDGGGPRRRRRRRRRGVATAAAGAATAGAAATAAAGAAAISAAATSVETSAASKPSSQLRHDLGRDQLEVIDVVHVADHEIRSFGTDFGIAANTVDNLRGRTPATAFP